MKLFISWGGEPSRQVAGVLAEWLPTLVQAVESFVSVRDIGSGSRWLRDLARELEEADFGILCVTPGNTEAPWMLFEAGALSKKVEAGRVCPVLLPGVHIEDLPEALRQFNSRFWNKEDVWKLVVDVRNAAAPKLTEPRLCELFDSLWPKLEEQVADVLTQANLERVQPGPTTRDLLLDIQRRQQNHETYLSDLLSQVGTVAEVVGASTRRNAVAEAFGRSIRRAFHESSGSADEAKMFQWFVDETLARERTTRVVQSQSSSEEPPEDRHDKDE